ncbi:kinase-like domain-containing protein [Rhizophagus irregularis DAOM 181602=DAOM 197198]|nr:kinase-like domain-containing protein [Rhizophagus irregularis DAOM 181602=DAOM 197198]
MYAKDGRFPEWVPYERFTDIKEIGEGGFAKVFSATWIDGESRYDKQSDGSCKKREPYSKKVALKRLNGSQNMSDKYLNELKIQWKVTKFGGLNFFGLTKDLETKEFMMIIQFAEEGNLRKNNKDCDSQLVDLEVSNSIKLRDTTVDENSDD